ncbi:MAG: transglycosylase SLT domain-containing protein [Propionivibrio sp.]|nr:transglycosylase SLT domain-containing protein [Propionivibrio sp.]
MKRRAPGSTQLVLGLIQVESGFKKYVVSSAGARGFAGQCPSGSRSSAAAATTCSTLRTNQLTAAQSSATT